MPISIVVLAYGILIEDPDPSFYDDPFSDFVGSKYEIQMSEYWIFIIKKEFAKIDSCTSHADAKCKCDTNTKHNIKIKNLNTDSLHEKYYDKLDKLRLKIIEFIQKNKFDKYKCKISKPGLYLLQDYI